MLLSTFNFKRPYLNIFTFFFFFTLIFVTYEFNIRKNPGNSMIIVDKVKPVEFDLKKQDLIILGSSRAVESIRPKFFEESFKEFSEALNFSCHSCTLLEHQINPIIEEFNDKKNLKKKIIVTVEPFLFRDLITNKDQLKSEPKITHFDDFNKKIKSFGSKLIFSWCESCKSQNRRELHNWLGFLIFSFKDIIETKVTVIDSLKKNYNHWITHRANHFSTKIVHRDKGFEGMELIRNDKSISLEEIFKKHQKFYPMHLKNFDKSKIKLVEEKLQILKNKKTEIILIRLPIHKSLYLIENQFVPEFNDLMTVLSENLKIPFLNFNDLSFQNFTSNAINFTDSSHLQFYATEEFNNILIKEIKKIWN